MASKVSKEQLVADNATLNTRNGLLESYLWDSVRNTAADGEAEETDAAADRVHGKLYRATSASGGYVVLTYGNAAGELTGCEIRYLEDISASLKGYYDNHTLPLRIVIERLMQARNKAYATVAA